METLNFHSLINEKSETRHLLLFHCRYFDKNLEMFFEWSYTKIYFLSKPLNLIGCHGNQKAQFAKIFKINLLRSCTGDKAKTLQNVHTLAPTKVLFFIAIAYALWLLWQLSFHRLII